MPWMGGCDSVIVGAIEKDETLTSPFTGSHLGGDDWTPSIMVIIPIPSINTVP